MSRRRQLEDELQRIYFRIPMALFVFLYWEIGRRQSVSERREESRRKWIDGEIARLNEAISEARAKAAGAAEAEKTRREQADDRWQPWQRRTTIIVTVATVVAAWVYLIAYHIGGL